MENNRPLSESTLAVFGAAGKFWTNNGNQISKLFEKVLLVDPALPHSHDPVAAAEEAHVLFISVSPDSALKTIAEQVRHCMQGKIFLENLTTKDISTLQSLSESGASVCSMHTMVKTDSPHEAQPMIVMPFDEECENAVKTAVILAETLGMHVERMPLARHGAAVTLPQSLEHLTARVKARALVSLVSAHDLSLTQLENIAPASQRLSAMGLNRILIQDPRVSVDIIEKGIEAVGHLRRALDEIESCLKSSHKELENLFAGDAEKLGITSERKREIKSQTDRIIVQI